MTTEGTFCVCDGRSEHFCSDCEGVGHTGEFIKAKTCKTCLGHRQVCGICLKPINSRVPTTASLIITTQIKFEYHEDGVDVTHTVFIGLKEYHVSKMYGVSFFHAASLLEHLSARPHEPLEHINDKCFVIEVYADRLEL